MTVEEIEIIVTAKVEEALKEFQKIIPTIKQTMKQAQESFSKIDTTQVKTKIQQAVTFVKKKIEDIKKSNANNEIAIKVTNKDAQKQISQIQKQIDSLQEKINARQMKLNLVTPKLDEITSKTAKEVTPDGIKSSDTAIQQTIRNSLNENKEYNSLLAQENKLVQEISMYNKQLDIAKSKMAQLGEQTTKTSTSQKKMTSFFNAFKEKIGKLDKEKLTGLFSNIPKITEQITKNIKNMGTGLRRSIGHVMRYAMALFSLRGIYSVLSNSANAWLSSQNAGAKQLSANIEYMKYAMGSAFAPIVQWVTGLIYNLMKAVQSVVYALFRVNIFANAGAKQYASMAKSAKKAKEETKQLASIHDEINNIQETNPENNTGDSGTVTPSFDLSEIDSQMSPIAQKLYEFFKPLKESWDTYGPQLVAQLKITAGQVGELLSSVWGSFEKIITNGTVYTTLELILAIIGNIAEAFANAWNYNGNGDAIVQNLANAFNNLLTAINNVVQSPAFQSWLNWCSDKFREISEKIASINWQPLINALMQIGTTVGTIALNILSGLVDIFKWLAENPIVAEILLAIAIAIGIISTAISVYNTVMGIYNTIMTIATAVSTAFGISIGWIIAIVVAIIAVIALVVLAIMNWDTIMQTISDTCNAIGTKVKEVFGFIKDFITEQIEQTKQNISLAIKVIQIIWNTIWNAIGQTAQNVWNAITTTISNVINAIKQTITNVLNVIKNNWDGSWNGLKNTVIRNLECHLERY